MKKSNLFSFFARGATATHPLCSVFTIALLFVFCSFSVSVRADSALSNLPLSDSWQFGQAVEAYNSLTPEQKEISDFLVGAQGNAFAGLSNYNLNSSFSSFDNLVDSFKSFGNKIWNNMSEAYQIGYDIGSGIGNKLSNFLGSTVEYAASQNTSFNVWLGNVGISAESSSTFRIGYYPDTTKDYINYMGDRKLYDWQFTLSPFRSNVVYVTGNLLGNDLNTYNNYLAQMGAPLVRANFSNYKDIVFSGSWFSEYCYLFVNTSDHNISLVNSSGNRPSYPQFGPFLFNYYGINYYANAQFPVNFNVLFYYDSNVSPMAAVNNFYNSTHGSWLIYFDDFIVGVYQGDSWANRVPLSNSTDLNFAPVSNYVSVYAPDQVIYLDIVGFIQDLYDNDQTIKKSVEDNSVISDGSPVTADIWNTISNYFTRPESGIHIGIDFFKLPDGTSPLFDTYIANLWRNTKDFVSFCGDILQVFTLDGGGGLAYCVYGGIAIGVIGGIFSKFLL